MPLAPRPFWLLAALIILLLALPLALVNVVPILDYPAHLTRVTLLSHLPLDPGIARAYSVDMRPLANLGMDLVVPLLAPLTGPDIGLKLFIAAGLAAWIVGAALIYRGLWREWSVQPLAAAFFALNPTFFDGFFNFHIATGLALIGTGLWLICRHSAAFLAAMALLAVALLFSHLMAVAILGLLLGGFEIGRACADGFDGRRLATGLGKVALIFIPAALLWLFVIERGPGGPISHDWFANALSLGIYSSQFGGLRFNAAPVVALLTIYLVGWRVGALALSRRALPAVTLCFLASLLMPVDGFGGAGVQIRLPSVVAVLILVAGRITLPGPARQTVAVGLVAVLAAGIAWQSARWHADAALIDRARAAIRAHVPEGGRLAAALGNEDRDSRFWHVVDLAIIDRKTLVPAFFTTPGQSTIRLNPAYDAIAATNAIDGGTVSFAALAKLLQPTPNMSAPPRRIYRDIACSYDALLVMGARPETVAVPAALSVLAAEPDFALYRITPPPERDCPAR